MLWRSLRDVAPSCATLAEDGRAELIYPDRREIRAWPSFESLDTAPAGGASPAATEAAAADLAASLARTLGGSVSAVSAGPSGRVAAPWTGESRPPWYRVVISSESGRVMTPDTVRVADGPRWSPSGELAAGAFDGIRRGVIMIDPDGGAARWWSRPASRGRPSWSPGDHLDP